MLDLETIGLAFDTSGLEKGARAFENTGKAADQAANASQRMTDSAQRNGRAMTALERVIAAANSTTSRAAQQTQDFIAKLERQNAIFGKSEADIRRYDASM